MNELINQSMDQSRNVIPQSINQSIDQSINDLLEAPRWEGPAFQTKQNKTKQNLRLSKDPK